MPKQLTSLNKMTAMAMECESGDEKNCLNKWTRIAIFTLVLVMATSVALAISFPYQDGDGDSYLRAAANAAASDGGGKVDVVLEDAVLLEDIITVVVDSNSTVDASVEMSGVDNSTAEKNNILPTVDAGANEKVSGVDSTTNNEKNNLLPTEDDETMADEVSSTEQTDNDVDASSTAKDGEQTTETIGGLFGPIVTAATNEQQSPNNAQANTTSTDSDNSSSCQMELQQADSNLDNVIDAFEYITFLHNVGSMSLSTTQFDDLPSEYQVNFDHLAKAHTDVTNDVGISIATMEELERVCVYISKKGSSAVHKFDWDQLSSLP